MKHNYEAVFFDGEPDERLPEWHVVKWDNIKGGNKLGHKVAAFYQDDEAEAKALADLLNKNPIWIIVDDGDVFEGHQGHWADCFFSNATESAIRAALEDKTFFGAKEKFVIREMTDEELERYPEMLAYREDLFKRYGDF
jgi:hypothetical protein